MATADTSRTRRLLVAGPIAVLAVGSVVLGTVLWRDRTPAVTPEPDPVRVEANSVYDFRTVEEMVAASDLVVRARVVDTARGELVGADGADPGAAGLVVRDVTLEVDEVLDIGAAVPIGDVSPGDRVVVAEEGWLATGEPLIVDGLGPSATGDDGIWFLQSIPAATTGDDGAGAGAGASTFLVISSQGRYLVEDGRLTGPEGDDPLVRTLEGLTLDQLATAVRG